MFMMPTGSPGTGWVDKGGGVLRNAFNGKTGERGFYYRFASDQDYAPPYVWSGKIRTVSMMTPPVFSNGTPAHYRPGLVFHPMYGSSTTAAASNDENVLIGLGTYDRPAGHVGISAELRAERPGSPYGVRTGYVNRTRGVTPSPFFDGAWHDFKVTVHSHAHYTLEWDGVILADVEEKLPATMAGRNHVGLRADFLDIEIKDFDVTTDEGPPSMQVPFGYGTDQRDIAWIDSWLREHYHPEYVTRLVAWLKAQDGRIGIGGAWRADGTQSDKPGFAPEGKSFHQNQKYSDGFIGAVAVDLVARTAGAHRSPYWAEVPAQGTHSATLWGLHCNVGAPPRGEPWHIQPIEIDGHDSWVRAGSPHPAAGYPFPWRTVTPTPPPPTEEDDDMLAVVSLMRPQGFGNVFAVTLDGARHLGGDSYARLTAQLDHAGYDSTVHVTDHAQEIASILALAGLTRADLIRA